MYLVYTIIPTTTTTTSRCGHIWLSEKNRKTVFRFYQKKRVDQKYDSSIKQIFVILDNESIYINQTR